MASFAQRSAFVLIAVAAIVLAGCSAEEKKPVLREVTAIIVDDTSCGPCRNLAGVIQDLHNDGVQFGNVRTVQYNSTEGTELVQHYNITRIPTLLLSTDINRYPSMRAALVQADIMPENGYYVLEAPPMYVEPSTGVVRGFVNITYLLDESCSECFAPHGLRKSFTDLGLEIQAERDVNISTTEGEKLIARYNITKVPTALITGEVGVYKQFNRAWDTAGSIEEDGTYVFRLLEGLGPAIVYHDLRAGAKE